MANISNKKFINSLSHKLDVTPRLVLKYLDAIIDEIIRETSRGNTVTIDRLGKFRTMLVGGYSQEIMGKDKYIKPKVVLKMKATKKIIDELSEYILPTEMTNLMEQADFENESNYEITTKTEYCKDDMYLIFEQIKEQIKNSNDTFLSEEDDDDIEDDEN